MWLRSDKRELRIRTPKSSTSIPGTVRCNRRKRKRSKISNEKCFPSIKGSASSIYYSRFYKKENKYTAQKTISDEITLFDGKQKPKKFNKSTVNSIKSKPSLSFNNDALNQFGPILYNTKTSTLVEQRTLEDSRDCLCNRSNNAQFSESNKRNDKNKKCISECDSTTELENDLQRLSSFETICVDYSGNSLINFNHVPEVDSTTDMQVESARLSLPSTSSLLYCHDTLVPMQDVQRDSDASLCLESPECSTLIGAQLYPTNSSSDSISMYESDSLAAYTSSRSNQLNELCQYSEYFHYTNGASMLSEAVDMHLNAMIPMQHQNSDNLNYSSQRSFGAEAIENLKALSATNFTDKSTTITLVNSQIYAPQR